MSFGVLLALLLLATGGWVAYRRVVSSSSRPSGVDDRTFQAVLQTSDQVDRVLARAARPLLRIPLFGSQVFDAYRSRIRYQLLAAGGQFGALPELFLAVQLFCVLLGFSVLVVTAVGLVPDEIPMVLMVVLAAAIAVYPTSRVKARRKSREQELAVKLPEFAELVQIPLTTMTVLAALGFTAERTKGLVSDEVKVFLDLLRNQTVSEEDGFMLLGRRLGTPEARALVDTWARGHLYGVQISDQVKHQAEQLRTKLFQERRAAIKRLPVKLVLIMGVHFLPSLLVLGTLPIFLAFLNVG